MIDDIIMRQPEEVRTHSFVKDNRVVIPTILVAKDIVGDIKEELKEDNFNSEKALILALKAKPKDFNSINVLLLDGGR